MTTMRRFFWIGLCLLFLAAAAVFTLLLYPQSQNYSLNVNLLDGTPARMTVTLPVRGWVAENQWYVLKISTQKGSSMDSLQLWSKVEMTGLEMAPQGISEHVIDAGEETVFKWKAVNLSAGSIPGVLWLYQSQNGGEKQLLYAKEFTFTASNFPGMKTVSVKVISGVLAVFGLGFMLLGWKKNPKKVN
jgi:hypothetical protein